jgi:hypothetical protein
MMKDRPDTFKAAGGALDQGLHLASGPPRLEREEVGA